MKQLIILIMFAITLAGVFAQSVTETDTRITEHIAIENNTDAFLIVISSYRSNSIDSPKFVRDLVRPSNRKSFPTNYLLYEFCPILMLPGKGFLYYDGAKFVSFESEGDLNDFAAEHMMRFDLSEGQDGFVQSDDLYEYARDIYATFSLKINVESEFYFEKYLQIKDDKRRKG